MKRPPALLGAAFLMATSAIGPGFLTQTARFTENLLTSFGFVILVSMLLDIGAQLNIWRLTTLTGKRAQTLASGVFPLAGPLLIGLIAFGGLVFNIGNIGGTGLGLQALTGLTPVYGAGISCLLAIAIFWMPDAGKVMDWVTRILGFCMIALTLYVAWSAAPPVGKALQHTVLPERIDLVTIITLVGGTVGGYISFAGAHRLIDAGLTGAQHQQQVKTSAITGIAVTSVMRYILFLAALGVVSAGYKLDAGNPAASVFGTAAGAMGYRFFGFVMWCAALTSVVGASYTSVSFLRTLHPVLEKNTRWVVTVFILASTFIFVFLGNPVKLLIAAGTINGFILPLALALILLAAEQKSFRSRWPYPAGLKIAGWLVVLLMAYMSIAALIF